jgi:hypothetical protein
MEAAEGWLCSRPSCVGVCSNRGSFSGGNQYGGKRFTIEPVA